MEFEEQQARTTEKINPAKRLSKVLGQPEKLFFVVVVVGVISIGASMWYWRGAIYAPFAVDTTTEDQQLTGQENSTEGFNELLAAQQNDTDRDGLTDYFEQNVYGTSVYLPDTDSDGITDKDEVDKGTNPLCPEGETCGVLNQPVVPADELVENLLLQPPLDEAATDPGGQLRQLLRSEGVGEEVLSQYTDEELLTLYQQVTVSQGTDVDLQNLSEDDLVLDEDMSPEEIRELLLQGGVEQEVLDQISDDELLDIFNEVITQESTN